MISVAIFCLKWLKVQIQLSFMMVGSEILEGVEELLGTACSVAVPLATLGKSAMALRAALRVIVP